VSARPAPAEPGGRAALLWLALAAAFSPVLVDLARNLASDPSAHPTALTPLLLAGCAWRGAGGPGRGSRDGLLWIALGAGLEGVGIAGGSWSLARLGLPVAVFGLARRLGRPAGAVAALAFWIVPVPHSIFAATTPGLEAFQLRLAGVLAGWVGVAPEIGGTVAIAGGQELQLFGSDGGAPLVAVLAQLGWAAALCRGASAARRVATCAAAGAAGLALQPFAIAIALVLLARVGDQAARLWLDDGAWLTAVAGALLYISRPSGRNEETCR